MMLIGTQDISIANARQRSVKIGHCTLKNNSEWPRGHPFPFLTGNDIGFKSLAVTLWVYGKNREDIIKNRSLILAALLEPTVLTLDGFTHKFLSVLSKTTAEETVMNRWHKLSLEFSALEFGTEVMRTFSGSTEFTVVNTGNVITPATIEITPAIGAASITINGICREYDTKEDLPVTVKELTAGKKVIINGQTGLITQDGELKTDIDIWSLPALLPGNNKITVNNNRMDITVRFYPIFV